LGSAGVTGANLKKNTNGGKERRKKKRARKNPNGELPSKGSIWNLNIRSL